MALVLHGISARDVYLSRAPLHPVHSQDRCARILARATPSAGEVGSLKRRGRYLEQAPDTAALAGVSPEELPVELLVADPSQRRPHAGARQRVWRGPVPAGGLCRVATETPTEPLYVVSPAFHLLLRCAELPFCKALMLAMELCGTYELRPTEPTGTRARPRPLTTRGLLAATVDSVEEGLADGERVVGLGLARKVAEAVVCDSASPRESAFAALCSLPRRLGGEGLDGLLLNHGVELTPEARAFLPGQDTIRYDLFWPEAGVACEYDSAAWHAGPEAAGRDDRRRLAARSMGHDLLTLSPKATEDGSVLDAVLALLRTALGKRPARPLSESSARRRRELRGVCLGHHRWW